ncbi:DHH family phosphoesterase [Pseudalkalibacillus berkeleyi]|uniref:Bifunctional oligoribonuclease/PAP phosphatase NrnA n=1 Tax=Pseudalkalibacillus berkeleyi TaxID=1069813 RepID=A0ABS9H2X3_9BACL|nr:bifunctional oligoribonuclease/PAP phosphatase NrnA [Pseudalkalibacillus berkeleyi]MCF6138213.1 bifunctional oligoribonuclease/PAP phosphatase NrnA [Pseudalkalibacillus berkeleyi]
MKEQIINKIKDYNKIIIHRHVRPDPDALGSQGGLSEILKATFPDKSIYVVGEEEPSLTFMKQMDTISDDVFKGALVIICDTANQARISDERFSKGDYIIKIDHHPNEDQYGNLIWVDTDASSVSEMIYEFYLYGREHHGFKLTDKGAELLYTGIVGDTGRFLFPNATEKTMKFAGELRNYDFDLTAVYNEMYKVSLNLARLNGYVLSHFQYIEPGVGYIYLTQEVMEQFNTTASESSLLVNTFSNVEGLKTWVFFVEEPDQIRVRLRSKGPVVNTIAAKYNGGGHPMASGATVHTIKETEQIIQDLVSACTDSK